MPATGIHDACTGVAKDLGNAGFVSDKDQAFAVAYAALRAYNDKNNILECLGKKNAPLALNLGGLLWRGVPTAIRVTQADVDNWPDDPVEIANQPPFDKIRGVMDLLMVRMGQYAKNTPPSPDTIKALPTLVSSNIVVSDLTQSTSLLQGGVPGGLPAFLDGLMAKGFYHFGCFSQNTDSTGKYAHNTNILFLAFKAKPDENKTAIQTTLAMFPVFSAGRLSALVASDNVDWIRFVLAHREQAFICNGFQVEDK